MQPRRDLHQRGLFEPKSAIPTPQLPKQIQEELASSVAQWLQALARTLRKENGDE